MSLGTRRYAPVYGFREPIDLWMLHMWNTANLMARNDYFRQMGDPRKAGAHLAPCSTCQKTRTSHKTGICSDCRKPLTKKRRLPCNGEGCTSKTWHESGLCYYCRINADRTARAAQWGICAAPGCTRAIRPDSGHLICGGCRAYHPPAEESYHWSHRYRKET